jgi:hypothetical protein
MNTKLLESLKNNTSNALPQISSLQRIAMAYLFVQTMYIASRSYNKDNLMYSREGKKSYVY